jgi:hypothetical protein
MTAFPQYAALVPRALTTELHDPSVGKVKARDTQATVTCVLKRTGGHPEGEISSSNNIKRHTRMINHESDLTNLALHCDHFGNPSTLQK